MKNRIVAICFAAGVLLLSATAFAATQYVISDATTVIAGGTIYGINEAGQISGWQGLADGPRGFRREVDGTLVDLGRGFAQDINATGQVVGSSSVHGPVIYNPDGSTTYLHSIAPGAHLQDINDAGLCTGWIGQPDGLTHAVICGASASRVLDLPEGMTYCQAYYINNQGSIAGQMGTGPGDFRAFFWSEGSGMVALPGLDGGAFSWAYGMNDSNQVAGFGQTTEGSARAMVWNADGAVRNLGYGQAFAINNHGQVAGWCGGGPCLWNTDGSVTMIGSLPGASGTQVVAINDQGIIAGFADIDGQRRIVIWTPVPEPSGLLAVLAGIGCVSLRRRWVHSPA